MIQIPLPPNRKAYEVLALATLFFNLEGLLYCVITTNQGSHSENYVHSFSYVTYQSWLYNDIVKLAHFPCSE